MKKPGCGSRFCCNPLKCLSKTKSLKKYNACLLQFSEKNPEEASGFASEFLVQIFHRTPTKKKVHSNNANFRC